MNEGYSGRDKKQLKYFVPLCIVAAALVVPAAAIARDVKVGGGVSVGYEFDDRQYDDDAPAEQDPQTATPNTASNSDERYSRFRIAPLITLSSPAARDEIALRYSPSYRYDLENSGDDIDHDLSATLSRYVTRSWQLKLSDKYLLTDRVGDRDIAYSDSPAESTGSAAGTESTVKLSDNDNRRKYWTNDVSLRSEHTYWEDSLFSLGYGYKILENIDNDESSSYENYDRHELSSSLDHRFTSVWNLSITGSYVRGLYDEVESEQTTTDEESPDFEKDLNEYRAATMLESKLLEHQSQKLSYSFYGVDYDATDQNNSTIHDMTLGWQWDLSKELMFSLGAGPTYTKTEGSDGEWVYNGNLACRYAFERGNIGLTASRGFERQNFTGTDENGLREFWQSRLSLNYQVSEDLSAILFSSYRYEDQEEITAVTPAATTATDPEITADSTDSTTTTETFNRQRFSTGASLGYTFWQWYKVSLSYDYSRQDSEQVDDSFNEHKVALTFSYEKELFNW